MPDAPHEGPVRSPCRRLCTLDEHDVCLGCGRAIDEITGWHGMAEADRRAVLERAAARLEVFRRRNPWAWR